MIRKLLVSSLMVLVLLFVAACGGGAPAGSGDSPATPAPASSDSATGAGAVAKPPVNSKPPEAAKPTEAADSSGAASDGETRDIKDISGSLDALTSYRLHFTFSFDGKDDQGTPQKGGMDFIQEVIKASKDRHIRFASTGDVAQGSGKNSAFEFYQVGGTFYLYSPDGQGDQKCVGMTSGENTSDLGDAFKPTDIVGGLEKAKIVNRGETINGVVSDHYNFDQSALTFGTFANAKGDVWLAQDGGFLVKYIGTATGKDNFLAGKSGEGTFTWEYNVEDANKVDAIGLPKECEAQKPANDIPLPENATEKSSFGQLITFKSPDAPADVAAFFKKGLPSQGWKAGEESALGDLETLNFSKANRKLSITITKEEKGGSSVLISEEKGS